MDTWHKVQFSLMACYWLGAVAFLLGDKLGSDLLFYGGAVVGFAALVLGHMLMWFELR